MNYATTPYNDTEKNLDELIKTRYFGEADREEYDGEWNRLKLDPANLKEEINKIGHSAKEETEQTK